MASLALGLVGYGITGSSIGWTIGSALGSYLFAPDGPNTQGPRLSDLSVQSSTRGKAIPKVYGRSRIAGNVIWTAGIQETATTQDVGGKGGPSATHTSYTYSCSFAVGICLGEIIGISRIWADSVLIYDKRGTATADDLAVSDLAGCTIYTGTETQSPDPTIEASEGSGNVPAFRGQAYVVFEDFQLANYGNRIPNFTFEVVGSDSPALSTVFDDICYRSGVESVDTSAISGNLDGYADTMLTGRAALEPLLTAFQCQAVESDYQLKFTSLSGAPAASIDYADMVGEVGMLREAETDLPRRLTVSYVDKDSDYLQAVQSAQRVQTTVNVVNESSAQFPLSSDSDHMAQVAEKILYRAWTEREKFDWRLTQKYAYLDAGDVVTISNDTSSHIVRITNGQMGLPGLIDCSGVATRASLYSSSVSGIASSYTSQNLVLVGDTIFEIMDLPALRDADATSAGFYVAVYGERANWTSGIVYRSTDGGSSWPGLVTTSTEATMGVTTDALGDGDHKTWDETNTVNISLYSGTLSSDTVANVLNGANAALVGDELIHFRTATLEGDGTYTLSGLLRGMKGTEHETDGHDVGDRFVLLSTTTIYRVSADYSKLNVTDKFKAVTNGQFLDSVTDTTDVTFTNLNSKPLSPCQIYGSRDGSNNLTINWQRRSRLTETSLDDPGLGEASELYEVHIMSGGVAIRVIQSTTNSTTYTAAQQTADGLTPGDPVTVNIYQVSDTVGRGYVRSETI